MNQSWILAAAVAFALASPAVADERDGVKTAAIAAVHPLEQGAGADLNRALRLARDRSVQASTIVEAIVRLGSAAIDPSLIVLDERALPAIDGGKLQVVSEAQEARVLDALRRMEPELVWNAVDARLALSKDAPPTLSARVAALLAAGTCAGPDELGRVAACARLTSEKELDPSLERAMQIAAADLFRRRPEGLARLSQDWRGLPQLLLPAIVEGAGATGDARALPALTQLLDQPADMERIALAQLSLQRAPADVPPELLEGLRRRLDIGRPAICQAACTALGELGDFGSVDALSALLAATEPGVRSNALHALCTMSSLNLPPQPASWRTWREHESEWFKRRARALADAVSAGTKQQASDALIEIGQHRWERHALSDIAAMALSRPEPELMDQASGVLQQLGSPRARVALQKVLERDDARRLNATRAALAALPTR